MILRGEKGPKAPPAPKRTPDSLRSTDTLEVILAYSEGETKGLANGGKEFFIGDTPLVNASGEANFGDFELLHYPGSGIDEIIRPVLGGLSNSTTVGVPLANETAVTRSGQTQNINFLEVRLVIQQLFRQTSNGDKLPNTLSFELEYKPSSGGAETWKAAYFRNAEEGAYNTIGHPNGNYNRFSGENMEFTPEASFSAMPIEKDVSYWFWQATAPTDPELNTVWFDSSGGGLVMKQWNGTSWVQLTQRPGAATQWNFTYKTQSVTIITGNQAQSSGALGNLLSGFWTNQSAIWLNPNTNKVMILQGGAWVNTLEGAPTAVGNKVVNINGTTSSNYVKELRWGVPAINDTYDIRIKKLSIDPGQGGDQENFIVVSWESFQEIVAGDREFPGTALFHLVGTASDQFSGLPTFSSTPEGLIFNVPINYNPETRVYTGIWNGAWKREYSNNPALFWNEMQLNDRFGASSYYPVTPNKWDVYEAAKWCDEQVPDGQGGTQPRWTFNQWITDAQGLKEFSRYLAGVFLGVYTDDGEGQLILRVDKDRNAVGIFTPENVVDGKFNYSFTDIQTRYNDITVTYKNPTLNYEEDRVRIRDEAHIAKYGRIATDIIAFGCRDRQEAIRRGRARLVAATTEYTTVSFKTNRQGANFDLYDVILIADPKLGYGITGRVSAFLNGDKTAFSLFDPVYLEPGITYHVNIQVPDSTYVPANGGSPFKTERRELAPGHPTGSVQTLSLAGAALDLPDNAVFALESEGYAGVPKPFRVLGIKEPTGSADDVEVICLEVNRVKWNYIDTGDNLDVLDYSSFSTTEVKAPSTVQINRETRKINGRDRVVLTIAWTRSDSPNVRKYVIYAQRNDGVVTPVGESRSTEFEYIDPPTGDYVFFVAARSITDQESLPARAVYRFVGDIAPVEDPATIRVEDAPTSGEFDVRSPVFVWG